MQISQAIFQTTKRFYCEDREEVQEISRAYNAAVSEEARALHKEAIIIDTCTFNLEDDGWHIQESGVTGINCTVPGVKDSAGDALRKIADYYETIRDNSERFLLVKRAEDIVRAKKEGKVGVIIGAQSCEFVHHHDIAAAVEVFQRLGLRVMQIAYNHRTFAADGCYTGTNCGITQDGQKLIRAMEQYGITVDLSHVGEKSTLEAMDYAEKPVIFSHANPNGLFKHPRNITDEQAKKCAATGGVVGVSAYPITLWDGEHFPTIDTFMDCICYYADRLGVDHVGIGIDSNATAGAYNHQEILYFSKLTKSGADQNSMAYKSYLAGRGVKGCFVDGVESLANFVNITDKLLKRGFTHEEAKKILGENWLRVFRETWK